ncbi:MAG: hypothetical protein ACOVRN_07425 [Flavobacterium sp.]
MSSSSSPNAGDFLNKFNDIIAKLNAQLGSIDINDYFQKQKNFSTKLIDDLTKIKKNIGFYKNKINELQQQKADIKKLKEDNENSIASHYSNIEDKTVQLASLQSRIGELESQLANANNDKNASQAELTRVTQELTKAQAEATQVQQGITDLNKQIESLQAENSRLETSYNQLKNTIESSYSALENASNFIQTVIDKGGDTADELTINNILKEINDLMNDIPPTQAPVPAQAQGQTMRSALQSSRVNKLPLTANINVPLKRNMTTFRTMPLAQIRTSLEYHSISPIASEDDKAMYKTVLKEITNARTSSEITDILVNNNIGIDNNNQLKGGRRTRRLRKQKGGFTYKSKSKRRSITSKYNSKRTTKRSISTFKKGGSKRRRC